MVMTDVKEEEVVNRIIKMAAQRHFSGDLSSISIQAIQSKNLLIRMKFTPGTLQKLKWLFQPFLGSPTFLHSYIFILAGLEPDGDVKNTNVVQPSRDRSG